MSDVDASSSPLKRRPQSVLFVCSQNSVRSPMAEALARRISSNTIYVVSVGLRRGEADSFTGEVLREIGILEPVRQPRALEDMEDEAFDLVVCLTAEARDRILQITGGLEPPEVLFWPIADPAEVEGAREHVLAAYRATRDALAERIRRLFSPRGV